MSVANRVQMRTIRLLFLVCLPFLLFVLGGCSKSAPDPAGKDRFVSRAATQQQGPITLRAAVLSDDESQRYFGASLADEGIQAVWLSVDNADDAFLYYLPITTDPNYFGAPEAAQLMRRWWRFGGTAATDAALARDAMPEMIAPHHTASGFVLTHREGGLKFLSASFIGAHQQFDFHFVLPLGGATYAVQKVDFNTLYPSGTIEAVDLAGLRARLEALPCCAANKAATRSGDPLNIVVVGNGPEAIFPFIARGWRLDEPFDVHSALRSVRAFLFGTEYLTAPVSPLYVFDRTQDISLQKARDKISQRNHLRLWQTPFTIDGQHVWIGQISRDIGIKLTTQVWYLTTHRISPEVDQDRYYLLQDLLMAGAISKFGFVRGVGASTAADPRTNLTHDPYVTDGLRLVVFISPQRRPLHEIEYLNWERPAF